MIKHSIKAAWRTIKTHKINAALNIFGLSMGLSASLIIFLISRYEMGYDTFHPDKERIYRIVANQKSDEGETGYIGGTPNSLPMTVRQELAGFESVASFYNYYAKVVVSANNQESREFDAIRAGEGASPIIIAEPQYFDVFKYQWLAGNPASALNEPFKVVLTENQAIKYFGSQSLSEILGKTIQYQDLLFNETLILTVSGIVKDWENQTDFKFTDFISFSTINQSFLKKAINLGNWGNWNPNAQGFVKLAIGQEPGHIEKQFPEFLNRHIPPYPGHTTTLHLQPLSDLHFDSNYRDNYSDKAHRPTLYGLMGIACFILLIAIINFINLSVAQSIGRAKEIGVRKSLGSTESGLISQFLIETFFLTLLAGGLSVILSLPVIYAFPSMIPAGVKSGLISPSTITFLLSVIFITSLIAGYYPAKVVSSFSPVYSLKGRSVGKIDSKNYFQKSLVVFQFVISIIFIVCTLVVGNQIQFIMNKDLGFNRDAIVTFHTGWNNPEDKSNMFAERIRQLSGVSQVSTHLETPATNRHSNTYIRYVDVPETKLSATYEIGDDNYVPLFGLTIVAGRNLSSTNRPGEFLINEVCAKQLGFKTPTDAIGKLVQTGMDEATGIVVGVVKDFHANSLHETIPPFFLSSNKISERAISVKLVTNGSGVGQFKKDISSIEAIWREIYPNEPFKYQFFDQTIARLYEREEKTLLLLKTAMFIAILICCMGLFGQILFSTQQRLKELGIRKVVGATTTSLVMLLSKDVIRLVITAQFIAAPIAYWLMQQWLADFAYRISISWGVFVWSGIVVLGIALLTISYHSIKAAMTNPIKTLRSE